MPNWSQFSNYLSFLAPILRIAVILVLAFLAWTCLSCAARRIQTRLEAQSDNPERLARLKTLLSVGRNFVLLLILTLAGLMILQNLDINITPLIAGAGIAGLALSLGVQTLIKDYIGGVLILVENQFNVGDMISIGDHKGEVMRITLRATYLRNLQGELWIIPNGDLRSVSNLSIGWARAIVDFSIPYDSDMQVVITALEKASLQSQKDPNVAPDLLEKPQVVGWVGHQDWTVLFRLEAKTRPGRQFQVANALRQFAFIALKDAGIMKAANGSDPH